MQGRLAFCLRLGVLCSCTLRLLHRRLHRSRRSRTRASRCRRPLRWSDACRPGPTAKCRRPAPRSRFPPDRTVLLDVSPPPLASLTIEGALVFDEADLDLTSGLDRRAGHAARRHRAAHRSATARRSPSPAARTRQRHGHGQPRARRLPAARSTCTARRARAGLAWPSTAPAGATQLELASAPGLARRRQAGRRLDRLRSQSRRSGDRSARSGTTVTLAQPLALRALRRAADDRGPHGRRARRGRAAHPQHRDPGRQRHQRGRLRRPHHGDGRHAPGRRRRAALHGAEGTDGPVPDALAHDGTRWTASTSPAAACGRASTAASRCTGPTTPGSRATSATTTWATATSSRTEPRPATSSPATSASAPQSPRRRGRASDRHPGGHVLDHQPGQHHSRQRRGGLRGLRLLVSRCPRRRPGSRPAAADLPRTTPLREFSGNVAHSNRRAGPQRGRRADARRQHRDHLLRAAHRSDRRQHRRRGRLHRIHRVQALRPRGLAPRRATSAHRRGAGRQRHRRHVRVERDLRGGRAVRGRVGQQRERAVRPARPAAGTSSTTEGWAPTG